MTVAAAAMPAAAATAAPTRLLALDRLRGMVMALMAVDHVDAAIDPRHEHRDGVLLGGLQAQLSAPEFLTRFCTHLCAPAFVFLAGCSVALSAANASRGGRPAASVDRHLLLRGLVLLLLEATLVSFYWQQGGVRGVVAQVLFAIGVGLWLLVPLRRLPDAALVALALLLPLGCEAVAAAWLQPQLPSPPLALQLMCTGGVFPSWREPALLVLYPALPWLPPLLLGFAFGRALAGGLAPSRARNGLLLAGGLALTLFVLLRAANAPFSNMQMPARDGSWLQWLHVSKYPPSVTYLALELGLMALLLAAAFAWPWRRRGGAAGEQRTAKRGRGPGSPLLVLGQVPLFFYLLHLPLIGLLLWLGALPRGAPWWGSWPGAVAVVLLAWPLCWLYRFYKQRWRHGWTRYL